VQSELCKASEQQEIVSCDGESERGAYRRQRRADDVGHIAGRGERTTESKAEELHSVEPV